MAQTLAGHLEDLDLDEVVRVIALSLRSGVLALETAEGNAELFFLEGRVVSAHLYDADETVAEILMVADVLEPGDLPNDAHATVDDVLRAAEEKRAGDGERSLAARADEILGERLAAATERVLSYRHGRFSFQVTDEEGPPPRYPQDTAITVAAGIDALEIASDHKQHRLSGGRGRAVRKGYIPRRGPELAHVFLAFDDDAFIEEIGRAAAPLGIHCEPVKGARGGIEALNSLSGPTPKILIVDLVMSRPDGRGILGGLEVLRAAGDEGCIDKLFLARDDAHRDADQLAMAMGALGTLEKPRFNGASRAPRDATGGKPDTATFFNPILRALGREPLVDKPIDIVDALREELGQDAPEEWQRLAQESPEKGRSLSVLKGLLGELNDPSFEEEIPLLVLRFSSAFFSRGALFHVDETKGELAGIGGFGISQKDAGRAIHATRIPLASNNLFARSLRERLGVRQPFFDSEWNTYLLNSLGGPRPREVYTAPLISARGLEAVLYADNALDLRPFPDIALLEIFLQQSGAAIERWSLKQRLQAIEGQ